MHNIFERRYRHLFLQSRAIILIFPCMCLVRQIESYDRMTIFSPIRSIYYSIGCEKSKRGTLYITPHIVYIKCRLLDHYETNFGLHVNMHKKLRTKIDICARKYVHGYLGRKITILAIHMSGDSWFGVRCTVLKTEWFEDWFTLMNC